MSSVSCEQICVFFQTMFDFFYHFFVFTFFIKIITTSSKGKETARSPKPAVSLPLNPSFFGHGLGLCPKNPLISEVSSVSYEQICVDFFINIRIANIRWQNLFRLCTKQKLLGGQLKLYLRQNTKQLLYRFVYGFRRLPKLGNNFALIDLCGF